MVIAVIEGVLIKRQYCVAEPDLNQIEDKTFFWIALSGILLQPFFLHHIYSVTHKQEMTNDEKIKLLSQDTDYIYEANHLAQSHQSSAFEWGRTNSNDSFKAGMSQGHSSEGVSQADSAIQSLRWSKFDDRIAAVKSKTGSKKEDSSSGSEAPSSSHSIRFLDKIAMKTFIEERKYSSYRPVDGSYKRLES